MDVPPISVLVECGFVLSAASQSAILCHIACRRFDTNQESPVIDSSQQVPLADCYIYLSDAGQAAITGIMAGDGRIAIQM
jgi:hypothetical protein